MTAVKNCSCNLFDVFSITPFVSLRYNFDGRPGQRVLFIESPEKKFILSFEEGMHCLDILTDKKRLCYETEYKNAKGYIHQLRIENMKNVAFFHFEYESDEGETVLLPGQLCSGKGYTWSEKEVEPVLVEIMNSITPCKKEAIKKNSFCSFAEKEEEKSLWKKFRNLFS